MLIYLPCLDPNEFLITGSWSWILFLALSNVIDQRMIVIQLKRSLCICCFIQSLWWILPLMRVCSARSTNISTFLELTGVLIVNLSGISSRVLHLSRNVRWFDIYISFWCSFPKHLHLCHHVRFITIWLFLLDIFIFFILLLYLNLFELMSSSLLLLSQHTYCPVFFRPLSQSLKNCNI